MREARHGQTIRSDRLHERLPVNRADGELADLAESFNAVLLRLEQAFEQLRRFTADASHELRTPLATMRSVSEVALQKGGSQEGYRDAIGSMLEEANRPTWLVESLLTIARADAGQIPVKVSRFEAVELLRECVSLFDVLLEENRQRLSIEAAGDAWISGDGLLLRQALMNVAHNAIKHTPRGGSIVLRTWQEPQRVVIEVEDSGPGIPEGERARVFDRSCRVEHGRSRAVGGAGLGLAIARWSVEVHGGTIVADGSATGGCVFRISLPNPGDVLDNTADHPTPGDLKLEAPTRWSG